MKKNLRLLCLGLAAATFAGSFAQEPKDMTSLLKNPTMEAGVKAWSFAASTKPMAVGKKNTGTSHFGYHGMSASIFEAWNGKATKEGTGGDTGVPEVKYFPSLPDGYAMQRLSGLESGTYVFGAYAGAALQGDSLPDSYKSIKGVYLFANDSAVLVQTNNPESKGLPQWAHTGKFNVAVTLSDTATKKGYLDLGLRIEKTNANFVMWDNATLYYFGDMSTADALDAMAKIDIQNSLAIADTLAIGTGLPADTLVINADTLTNYLAALAEARTAVENSTVTAANLWDLNEGIYHNKGLVHKSAMDYANLKKDIDKAQMLVDSAHWWSDDNELFLEALGYELESANEAYTTHKMNREELTALRKSLNYAAGDVKMDSVLAARDILDAFIKFAKSEDSNCSAIQIKSLEALAKELGDTITVYGKDSQKYPNAKDRKVNPNNLYNYVAKVLNLIEDVKNNPVSNEYTQMPIEFAAGENGWIEGAVWHNEANKIVAYTSPQYRFPGKISNFRITVKNAKNGQKYFCLSELEFFDENGNKIPLVADSLSTNACHITNHPDATGQGEGIPGLFDGDVNTFFHSEWINDVGADHYLEVHLPNGGYSVFSFRMLSRSNSNGYDQSHTFPGKMIIATPTPQRDLLENNLATLKNLNAYSVEQINELGFYINNFDYVLNFIDEIEAFLEGHPSEAECENMNNRVTGITNQFGKEEDMSVRMPEDGKAYRILSAHPGFRNNQQLDKAFTFHAADSTLWWETAGVDSVNQLFKFTQLMEDEEPVIEVDTDNAPLYCYTVQHVETKLYLSGSFTEAEADGDKRIKFVKEPETLYLKSLGIGQWQLKAYHSTDEEKGVRIYKGLDMYDNGGGAKGDKRGDYGEEGSIKGVNAHVGPYTDGLNSGSALYIRELTKLPVEEIAVKEGEFKSKLYTFQPGNNIVLTADADCAFENLHLYTLMGDTLAVDTITYKGATAHIITPKDIVECTFGFTVPAGVTTVDFNAYHYVSKLGDLQEVYDAVVAKNYVAGDSIGLCKDVTELEKVLAEAAAMLENGATDEEMAAMIKSIKAAEKALEINLPAADKYYYIQSALGTFPAKVGYDVAFYQNGTVLAWGPESDVDNAFYWQFEQATKTELQAMSAPDTICAFFVKNVATGEYIGGYRSAFEWNQEIPMAETKTDAMPYIINTLSGSAVALDAAIVVKDKSGRLHANGHGNGGNRGGKSTYWNSGVETASAWHIVETQYDMTDIDFAEVEEEKAVVKGTYDLFGRRVVAPTAPGLYIIDGKKKYIKK